MAKSTKATKRAVQRPRELIVTLNPIVWAEFQRRLDASGLRGTRGVDSHVLNAWLMEAMQGRSTAPAPPAAATDDDGFGFDTSKL